MFRNVMIEGGPQGCGSRYWSQFDGHQFAASTLEEVLALVQAHAAWRGIKIDKIFLPS